ncbi:hypothetical protein Aduo_008961 [Ancylostoma duodenale]
MPSNVGLWEKRHHVVRLTDVMEISDGRSLHEIPAFRVLAYFDEIIVIAPIAIDDVNGGHIIDHESTLLCMESNSRTRINMHSERDVSLARVLKRDLRVDVRYPDVPLLHVHTKGIKRYFTMEQIWLTIPHACEQRRNHWEVLFAQLIEPMYIPNSPLPPTDDERSITDSDVDPYADGGYTSDEIDDAIERVQQ